MKTLQSQLSLNRVSSNTGLTISILVHCFFAYVIYFNHPFIKIKPSEDKSFKIELTSYKPITAPVVAPVVSPPPPQPEPVVVPPKPQEPVVQKEQVVVKKEKPKKKKNPEKIVKKEKPLPEPTPEPVVQIQQPAPVQAPSESVPSAVQSTQPSTSKVATAPTVGEFNMQTSSGDENFYKIRKAIEKYKKYPKNAQKMRQQGIAEVRFLYKKNGSVEDIHIVKSSGYTSLDDGAIKCIERASKEFPVLDKDYRITIPIGFRLI